MRPEPPGGDNGFTLVEALASVAVMALILLTLGAVAGQWLPHWRHGFQAVQNADLIAQSLDRIVADIAAAEFAKLDKSSAPPLFRGEADAVMFVRAASGPGAGPRLEYVRIGTAVTPKGVETQRTRADFAPGPIGPFRNVATVLHPPFRLAFAYQAPDGHWAGSWSLAPTLPRAMRLTVNNGTAAVASTAFLLHTTSGPDLNAQQTPKTDEPPPPADPAKTQ